VVDKNNKKKIIPKIKQGCENYAKGAA